MPRESTRAIDCLMETDWPTVTTNPSGQPLTAANAREHASQLERYERFLEAATCLDFAAMSTHIEGFADALGRHMQFEEEEVLKSFREHCPDRRAEIARIEGDHRILLRVMDSVRLVLRDLAAADEPRRTLVRRLGVLDRLRDVLEHHTLRESTRLYPFLDQALPVEIRDVLCRRMQSGALNESSSCHDP